MAAPKKTPKQTLAKNTTGIFRSVKVDELSEDEIDLIEKISLRLAYQAAAQFADQAWEIFKTSPDKEQDIAEDVNRELLDSLAGFPIRQRIFGTVDYKKARWLPTPFGLVPQSLLVDAKAENEDTRARLQLSQVSMKVTYRSKSGNIVQLDPGLQEFIPIKLENQTVQAITTMILAHYDYGFAPDGSRFLENLRLIAVPHGRLVNRYCPSADDNIWIEGPHSKARKEDARLRISFKKMREKCPWRMQIIEWDSKGKSTLMWHDLDATGKLVKIPVTVDRITYPS